jgi:hypothetical protein
MLKAEWRSGVGDGEEFLTTDGTGWELDRGVLHAEDAEARRGWGKQKARGGVVG